MPPFGGEAKPPYAWNTHFFTSFAHMRNQLQRESKQL
jgi:hypothetical protein